MIKHYHIYIFLHACNFKGHMIGLVILWMTAVGIIKPFKSQPNRCIQGPQIPEGAKIDSLKKLATTKIATTG